MIKINTESPFYPPGNHKWEVDVRHLYNKYLYICDTCDVLAYYTYEEKWVLLSPKYGMLDDDIPYSCTAHKMNIALE